MDVNFSLFAINVPDYLILRARSTASPGAEVARDVIGPAFEGTLNFLMTGLNVENYFFDLYESVDGSALSQLLGTFTYDVKNEAITDELRFYVVDSGVNNSPANGDTTITDDYLTGKTVASLEKRSIGSLLPDGLGLGSEWSVATNVITLLGGLQFSSLETYCAHITYAKPIDTPVNTGFFKGIKVVTANVTTDNSFRNCRIKCNGAGLQLVITMEDITSIPDGTFWYFVDQDGGLQYQTKLLAQTGASFLYNGQNLSETYNGKAEELWIEKQGTTFEIIKMPTGQSWVGKRFAEGAFAFPNQLAEDNALWGADDWPRLWYWITHAFPDSNYYIVDDNLDNVGYVRPVDVNGQPSRTGMFIISFTKRKFRMPDTRGYSEKGAKQFAPPFIDANRTNAYPGGFQQNKLQQHVHNMMDINPIPDGGVDRYLSRTGSAYNYSKAGATPTLFGGKNGAPDTTLITGVPRTTASATDISSTENIVNNFSVIYMRYV